MLVITLFSSPAFALVLAKAETSVLKNYGWRNRLAGNCIVELILAFQA